MSKALIHLEIRNLVELIREQQELVLSHQGKIPQLEIDLLMGNIRNLYESMLALQKVNQTIVNEPFSPEVQPKTEPPSYTRQPDELIASVIPHPISHPAPEPENSKTLAEQVMAKASETIIAEPVVPEIPWKESEPVIASNQEEKIPSHPVQPELLISEVETPVEVKQVEEVPQEVIPQVALAKERAKEFSKPTNRHATASLFDDSPTIADKFQGSPTLHDKISHTKEDKSLAGKLQKNPITDLKKAIGINQKFAFINELFDGNSNSYNTAIEKINSFTDHKQAVSFVETELMPVYGWTADGDAFAQLQELILRRFIS
ncbi:MAG: hypothetical protein IPP34_08555 [Bacteroidetes bacterium]|nr:hypothetical protein [Bacteroidota bacterium]MBL0071848.1 hypothetical protein [Bacteroidota bacterium]